MADQADEPLIGHGNRDRDPDEERPQDLDVHRAGIMPEENLRHPGLFVWLLTFSAGISGLLFGCKPSIPPYMNPAIASRRKANILR